MLNSYNSRGDRTGTTPGVTDQNWRPLAMNNIIYIVGLVVVVVAVLSFFGLR